MKLVAVEGMTLDFGDSVPVGVELGNPSGTVKAEGKGCYAGYVAIKLSDVKNASVQGVAGSGNGFFIPSSAKCTADNEKLMLVGDKATIEVKGVHAETGVVVYWVVVATIVDAGQNTFKAD